MLGPIGVKIVDEMLAELVARAFRAPRIAQLEPLLDRRNIFTDLSGSLRFLVGAHQTPKKMQMIAATSDTIQPIVRIIQPLDVQREELP